MALQPYWATLLNAAVNSHLNKNDPYSAITYYRNIMAMMPPEDRPKDDEISKVCGDEPKLPEDFTSDPDLTVYEMEVRQYLRKYSFLILSKIGQKIITDYGSRKM